VISAYAAQMRNARNASMPIHIRAIPQTGQPLLYPDIITTISSRPAFPGHCPPLGPRYPMGGSAIRPASR